MIVKEKVFDSVKMMRDIRDTLSKKYNNDPDFSVDSLKSIKKKYTQKILLDRKRRKQSI